MLHVPVIQLDQASALSLRAIMLAGCPRGVQWFAQRGCRTSPSTDSREEVAPDQILFAMVPKFTAK